MQLSHVGSNPGLVGLSDVSASVFTAMAFKHVLGSIKVAKHLEWKGKKNENQTLLLNGNLNSKVTATRQITIIAIIQEIC